MIVLPQSGYPHPVRCLAFSPDGLTLACSGRRDCGVALWDLMAREPPIVLGGQKGMISSIAFSPDSKLLASATSAGSLWVWSLKPRALVREEKWSREQAHAPGHVCFSPDGRWLATMLTTTVARWNTHYPVYLLSPGKRETDVSLSNDANEPSHLAFSPDGSRLAVASFDRSVSLFDVDRRSRLVRLEMGQKAHYVAFSPDGKTLAAGSQRGLVKLWDAATGRKLLTLKGQATPLRSMCYSPDGKVIVTAGGEGIVTFWDVQSGKSRTAFDWGIGEVHSVCFAADGMRAAAGGVGKVVIWDVDGWEV